jgi:electron transfer flavoprotein beta subunit
MTGYESADHNGIALGSMLAQLTSFAYIGAVTAVNLAEGKLTIDREIDGGKEVLNTQTPALVSVQKGIAIDPRIPAMRGIMMARRKPLTVVEPVAVEALTEVIEIEMPKAKSAVKMFEPENLGALVNALRNEANVL